jgi:hypothetical protein
LAAAPALGWQTETVDSEGDVGQYASLALDTKGLPTICYYDGTNGSLKVAHHDGAEWHLWTVEPGSTGYEFGEYCSLALTSEGGPRVSYYNAHDNTLRFAEQDGTSWSVETAGWSGGQHTSLALDASDLPHISHYDTSTGDLIYTYYDGKSWQSYPVDQTGDVGQYSSLALHAGRPHISYYDAGKGDLKYAYYMAGGQWSVATVDSTGDVGAFPSLALDADGYPHVAYLDITQRTLEYAVFDGKSWAFESVEGKDEAHGFTSLALDAQGNPHISYAVSRTLSYDLKYAYHDGQTWSREFVDSAGSVGTHTSVALDADGRPYLSYYDETKSDLKVATLEDPCPTPLEAVTINGPGTAATGTTVQLTAQITPLDATQPVVYTWSPDPSDGQGTAQAEYRWDYEDDYTVSLGASNCGDAVSDEHTIVVQYVPPVPQPDLVITDVWEQAGQIWYQVANPGPGLAPKGHSTGLRVDGTQPAGGDDTIGDELGPGERLTRVFDGSWSCTTSEDTIEVCADYGSAVEEADDTNNCREEVWKCDAGSPVILSGPAVSAITASSATITWTTDEASDSVVQYGRSAFGYGSEAEHGALVLSHQVTLHGLTPFATYGYQVESADASGNTVASERQTFRTLAQADTQPPAVSLVAPSTISGTTVLSATVVDAGGVEFVGFYLNGALVHTDYSEPFRWLVDSTPLANDTHQFEARAVDRAGNLGIDSVQSLAQNAFQDTTVPWASFDLPHEGEVGCEATVSIRTRDPDVPGEERSGIRVILYYVDQPNLDGMIAVRAVDEPFPGEHADSFTWDTTGLSGKHTLIAHVYDGAWNETELRRTVSMAGCRRMRVRREDVQQEPGTSHFSYTFVVENLSQQHTAHNVEVTDTSPGFVVVPAEPYVKVEYDTWGESSKAVMQPGTLLPGESREYHFMAVPILVDGGQPRHGYVIGSKAVIKYRYSLDEWVRNYPVSSPDTVAPPELPLDEALASSDYLLVTHPARLALQDCGRDPCLDAGSELLVKMGELAVLRNGVLGLLREELDPERIKDLLLPDGEWGARLHPAFGQNLGGHVLFVGESEIVPGWLLEFGNQGEKKVPYSDQPYADTQGFFGLPELIVGRIIGNTLQNLIVAIDSSIDVARGEGFDGSLGVVTSGNEWEWENFSVVGDAIRTALNQRVLDANAWHWMEYVLEVKRPEAQPSIGFNLPLSEGDGFVLADLDGDGAREIVAIDEDQDTARVYAYGGLDESTSTPAGSFPLSFGPHDGLAAGDVTGDGADEILVAEAAVGSYGSLSVYQGNGVERATDLYFTPWDGLATGQLLADAEGKAEIAVIHDEFDRVRIFTYDSSTGALDRVATLHGIPFSVHDGFAIGDVSAASPMDELVIADNDQHRILIYDAQGVLLGELPVEPLGAHIRAEGHTVSREYAGLAVGDVDGDGMDEIAIIFGDRIHGRVPMVFYDDDSWQWNAAEEEWEIKPAGELRLFSRFLNGFNGIRTTGSDTRYDGFAIGDVSPTGSAEIVIADVEAARTLTLNYRTWHERYIDLLRADASEIDILTLNGHGSAASVSPFGVRDGDVAVGQLWVDYDVVDLASTLDDHPFVFALSCLSGNYEGQYFTYWKADPADRVWVHRGDLGIAETFLAKGAGVYVGATQLSYVALDSEAGPDFFWSWEPGASAGRALAAYERQRIPQSEDWRFWAGEYNYYGDPKYGATRSTPSRPLPAAGPEAEPPPATLFVSIPAYEVSSDGEFDYVDIPSGGVLLEDYRPRVPLYSVEVELPAGTRIQDVELVERAGLSTSEGLGLTTILPRLSGLGLAGPPTAATAGEDLDREWYPTEDFHWRVIPNLDGTSTLILMIYPFFYNPLTTGARFYQDYTFQITSTESAVTLTEVAAVASVYGQGDPVTVDIDLHNAGEPLDVVVEAVVKGYGSDRVVEGLLLRTLTGVTGTASFSPVWDSSECDPGLYYVEVSLGDSEGKLLDVQREMFRLGVVAIEVAALTATPEVFAIGQSISTSLTLRNAGTVSLSGQAVVAIQREDGNVVEEFRQTFKDLAPAQTVSFEHGWDSTGAEPGDYRVIGYAMYESTACEPEVAVISTTSKTTRNYLPLILRR